MNKKEKYIPSMYFKQKTLFWGQLFLIILKFFQNTNAFLLFNSHLKDRSIPQSLFNVVLFCFIAFIFLTPILSVSSLFSLEVIFFLAFLFTSISVISTLASWQCYVSSRPRSAVFLPSFFEWLYFDFVFFLHGCELLY